MKIITPYNFSFDWEKHAEKPQGESLTVPDMSMSIKDMIANLLVGIPVSGNVHDPNSGYPSEDPDFDDYLPSENGDFDLSDYHAETLKIQYEREERLNSEKLKESLNKQDTQQVEDDVSV